MTEPQPAHQVNRLFRNRILPLAMALYLLLEMGLSLSWRMFHDVPIVHYVAYLVGEHEFVLYRDVFETSMPGTILLHLFIGKTVGWGDLAIRCVDLVWLTGLMSVTWLLLRRFSRPIAWAGSLGFGLLYLHHGPIMSFQRDCVGMLFVAAALLAAARTGRGAVLRFAVVGGLFGLAASIKPHLAIGLPVVFGYQIAQLRSSGEGPSPSITGTMLRAIPAAGSGFAVVAAVPVLWLWSTGGLSSFSEMLTSYLPLYLQMNGDHEVLTGASRWGYLLEETLRGVCIWGGPVLLAVFFALYRAGLSARKRRLVVTLGLLTVAYALYPGLAGQFWTYHWMPFRYFALASFSLCLLPVAGASAGSRRMQAALTLIFVLITALAVRPSEAVLRQLRGQTPDSPRLGRVDTISEFLEEAELQSGETVQPLEWTNSAVHGMLRSESRPATRFLYTYQFHHHQSEPLIRKWRREFIEDLEADPPRFMIDVVGAPRPSGPDCDGSFPELLEIIRFDYRIALEHDGVRIYERHD